MKQKNEKYMLDAVDLKILRVLQEDGTISITDLAKQVGISQAPCWRRVKQLKDDGIITRTVAILNREALGLSLAVYASVKLSNPSREAMEQFDEKIRKWPEVISCERVSGSSDYLLKIVAQDIQAYDQFLRTKLLDLALVSGVQSSFVVSTIKDTAALPVG